MKPAPRFAGGLSRCLVLASLAACSSPAKPPVVAPDTASPDGLEVAVVSVTLAQDCTMPDSGAAAAPPPGAAVGSQPPSTASRSPIEEDVPSAGDVDVSRSRRGACVQTSVQLHVQAPPGRGGRLSIKRAELIDASGKVLGELTAFDPKHYNDHQYYVPWDQQVDPGTAEHVSWSLTSPQWYEYGLSPDSAAGGTYRVRLTVGVEAGNGKQAAEQVVAGDASLWVESPMTPLEPPAVT